jgi:hypothetical protein
MTKGGEPKDPKRGFCKPRRPIMTEMNGVQQHPVDLDAVEAQTRSELQRAGEARASITIQEAMPPSAQLFDQKAHDLLIRSIDQVATDWVGELQHVRNNSMRVEALVMQRAAKVKADITALYLLGNAALAEAKRGDDVNAKLTTELERLTEQAA